jgi:hypothetical protein
MKSKLEPFKDTVIKMYVEDKLTCKQIGQKFKMRPGPVSWFLEKNGVTLRKGGQQKGSRGPTKGKKFTERSIAYNTHTVESGKYKTFVEACIRKVMRTYIINRHGHRCQQCGLTEWRGHVIPLVCDHIDGNAQNCEIENFRLICNNCDSISSTYKGKNRGNGRKLKGV